MRLFSTVLSYTSCCLCLLYVVFVLFACSNWFFQSAHDNSISCHNITYPFPVIAHSVLFTSLDIFSYVVSFIWQWLLSVTYCVLDIYFLRGLRWPECFNLQYLYWNCIKYWKWVWNSDKAIEGQLPSSLLRNVICNHVPCCAG